MNEQDTNVSFFRFEDLRIYAKAMDYITWLYGEIQNITDDALAFLKESFLKSAHGIALNTAEGSSRNKTQFLYYLKMAKSSVRECVVYTEIATRKGVFQNEATEYSRNQLMELTKMIGSLIASLQRSAGAISREEKDEDMLDPINDMSF
ncbi:MAG: four helix bundle protein [Bacteroidales bacterium]|nr:four helix bundle protein [Bacteroidales bacterium]